MHGYIHRYMGIHFHGDLVKCQHSYTITFIIWHSHASLSPTFMHTSTLTCIHSYTITFHSHVSLSYTFIHTHIHSHTHTRALLHTKNNSIHTHTHTYAHTNIYSIQTRTHHSRLRSYTHIISIYRNLSISVKHFRQCLFDFMCYFLFRKVVILEFVFGEGRQQIIFYLKKEFVICVAKVTPMLTNTHTHTNIYIHTNICMHTNTHTHTSKWYIH